MSRAAESCVDRNGTGEQVAAYAIRPAAVDKRDVSLGFYSSNPAAPGRTPIPIFFAPSRLKP